MKSNEILETGSAVIVLFARTFAHGWDAGVMFEETDKTLLCSDLFHQMATWSPYR
jgi:hypothetical protein